LQLGRLWRKRIGRQALDTCEDTSNKRARNWLEIFFDRRPVTETIGGYACGAASSCHQQ
jgi:hypothetical protein